MCGPMTGEYVLLSLLSRRVVKVAKRLTCAPGNPFMQVSLLLWLAETLNVTEMSHLVALRNRCERKPFEEAITNIVKK